MVAKVEVALAGAYTLKLIKCNYSTAFFVLLHMTNYFYSCGIVFCLKFSLCLPMKIILEYFCEVQDWWWPDKCLWW